MFHAAFSDQPLQLGGLRVAVFGERRRGGAAKDSQKGVTITCSERTF